MTASQSIAARRKARQDPRYSGRKRGDIEARARRYAAKVKAEQERRQRAKGKK